MKKISVLLAVSLFITSFVFIPKASAEDDNGSPASSSKPSESPRLKNIRNEIRQEKENLKTKVSNLPGGRIIAGVVKANNTNNLVVTSNNKDITVNVTNKTNLRRLYWGKATITEIAAGNKVNVWGKWTDSSEATMNAALIRDLSIMKRNGTFFGTVKTKNSDNFVMTTINRGDQTVYFTSGTKFTNRKGAAITYDNVSAGDKLRVKGLWDYSNNQIAEVAAVKDFSLPVKASPQPSAST